MAGYPTRVACEFTATILTRFTLCEIMDSKMTKRLQTVDEVIDAFGGAKTKAANNKAVAVWLGLNTSAVCNWRERENIPSGWHLRFYLKAAELSLDIDHRVFGIEPDGPVAVRAKKKRRVAKGAVEPRAARAA